MVTPCGKGLEWESRLCLSLDLDDFRDSKDGENASAGIA